MRRLDAAALHPALHTRRRASNLSWAALARELRASLAALSRLRAVERVEADRMLATVHWPGVPVETFVRDVPQ